MFTLVTLKQGGSEIAKKQEIGRGLRLPVNTSGCRCKVDDVNELTVIANDYYDQFAAALQDDYNDSMGFNKNEVSADIIKQTMIKAGVPADKVEEACDAFKREIIATKIVKVDKNGKLILTDDASNIPNIMFNDPRELKELGVSESAVFWEYESATKLNRPELTKLFNIVQAGDTIVCTEISRITRSTKQLCDIIDIDSSKEAGKLMISVLSAVAEIERENIRAQTMLGRLQKAREGEWNGGFAPYGYQLIDGKLVINEEEAKIIRLIFDKFNHTTMGVNSIATFLNQHGYKKTRRQNNKLETFAGSFIKGVLDNPVYNGKIAYGRRKSEKIAGAHNEYHIVKQDEYMLYNGIHDAIIPDEEWELAQQKRKVTGVRNPKTHSLEHEHILSGILKCPVCGNGMYGNVNRKRNKSGDYYKDYFYYA